ncbi:MAG: polysaccharide deacetylase family protein [Clostridia bacterium]|nr:polysaccharide deacetylase family protein [Clostridia bacterium]
MYFAFFQRKSLVRVAVYIAVFIAACTALFSTKAYAVFYGGNLRKLPIYSVQTDEKKIAISFDCAWGVDYTDELLKIMERNGVRCTFFVVQFWAEKYPEYLKKIAAAGHEIGTHSATHPYMSRLDETAITKELETSCAAIERATGVKPELFRPPYGDYDDLLIDVAKSKGLYTIQWSVDSLDWKNISASEIRSRVVGKVKNGSIVLFHNQGLHTSEALENIITDLKGKGYGFVPIGELIYRENYTIGADGTQMPSV